MTFKMKSMSLAVMQVLASGALTALAVNPAMAQQTATDDAQPTQRVVVTGSYISRADKETPSPVQVMTADDLKKSGYTTVAEALRDITANGQGTLSQGFNQAFAAGASGVSLRGLSVGATLVLIDGHRMAAYPFSDDGERQFVDISSIPFEAVERIEILKDGASAVYGSDAIAGVVNVILKKSFQGTSITAESGTTQHGGGATNHVSFMHGFGDPSDGKYGFLAVEYRHQEEIKLNERSGAWTNFDFTGDPGGNNLNQGAKNSAVTYPVTRTPYLTNPAGASGAASTYAFLGGGCDYTRLTTNQCTYANNWAQIEPTSQNVNVLGSFTDKLNDNWQLDLKASIFDSKNQQTRRPQAVPAGSFAGNTGIGPNESPTIFGGIPAGTFTVPANYPGNTLGVPAVVRALIPGADSRNTDIDTKSYRLVAELTGTLGSWDVNVAAGATRVETSVDYTGYINNLELYKALNDPIHPFNLNGGNSAAVMALIAPRVSNTATDELNFIDARASRELMTLPGGPLSLGAGVSFVHKSLSNVDPVEAQNGTVAGISNAYAIGKENNSSVYMELAAPIIKTLEVDAAFRSDHFDTYGNSTTPKIGFKFTPSAAFSVRGTASKGFRAPSATENGVAGSTFSFNQVRDPVLCAVSNPDGSPNLTSAANVPSQCKLSPAYLQTTNANLQPEKSKSYTFGFIVEPVRDWSTTLDFYKITVDNQIITESSLPDYDAIGNAVRGTPQTVTYGDGHVGTSSVGQIQYITSPYVNGQTTSTKGVEFETRYKLKLANADKVSMGLQWTHMFDYDMTLGGITYDLAGTHGPSVISGDTGNPKDRAQLTLSYEHGPLTLTSTTNYISGYGVTDPSSGLSDCQSALLNAGTRWDDAAPVGYCHVASFTYTNLTAQYKFSKALTLTASVENLFDKAPPVDMQTYGGAGSNLSSSGTGSPYNPSLHQTGAIGRFFNLGLNYKF